MAQENPAAYEPDLAESCNNLASLLNSINRKEEAEQLHREALEIRRRLAQENPTAYEPDLASSCNNLACLLSSINQKEEAETLYREALKIYEKYPHLLSNAQLLRDILKKFFRK